MNNEKLKAAFRRGVCRICGLASTVAIPALDRLAKTPDGFSLADEYIAALQNCINRARELADPSRPSLIVTRPNDRGTMEFRAMYVDDQAADRNEGPTLSTRASPDGEVSDPGATGAEHHAPVSLPKPSRLLGAGVDAPSAADAPCLPTSTDPTATPTQSDEHITDILTVAPTQPSLRQSSIDLAKMPDALGEQSDIDLVRQMLTAHQAGQLTWYDDVIDLVDQHAHSRERVLHMLRGDGRAGSDTDWVDTTTAGGSPVSWAGFQRIRVTLPYKAKLFVVGHVHECRSLKSMTVLVSVQHVVTPALAHACVSLRKSGTPRNHTLIEIKVSSRDLYRRAALYCDRGPVRFKIRLSRGLAVTAPYYADLEDLYLDDPAGTLIDEEIEWITTALRRRPPNEPEWCERSV